ncbi:MAG TPA: helix-turn-helix transcriptional regulator [Burkholderiales bacterium]|nr:helix-turn-helix transcriptional regulator [Burkholderiales bacterium]
MERNYAKAFRIVRAAFGLKQSELAARMPITASQLSLIEAGKRQPSVRVVDALASAVGVPAALISLLASAPNEMDSKSEQDVSDLSRALLRLLVTAKEEPQQNLKFNG